MTNEGSEDPNVSAVVVLRPASGRRVLGTDMITSENVESFLPDPQVASGLVTFFKGAGFEVSEPQAMGFSISGPVSLFERVFGERLRRTGGKPINEIRTEGGRLELPLDRVPSDLRDQIETVTFTRPPDFGPTEYR